jgi:hypothetical protein
MGRSYSFLDQSTSLGEMEKNPGISPWFLSPQIFLNTIRSPEKVKNIDMGYRMI